MSKEGVAAFMDDIRSSLGKEKLIRYQEKEKRKNLSRFCKLVRFVPPANRYRCMSIFFCFISFARIANITNGKLCMVRVNLFLGLIALWKQTESASIICNNSKFNAIKGDLIPPLGECRLESKSKEIKKLDVNFYREKSSSLLDDTVLLPDTIFTIPPSPSNPNLVTHDLIQLPSSPNPYHATTEYVKLNTKKQITFCSTLECKSLPRKGKFYLTHLTASLNASCKDHTLLPLEIWERFFYFSYVCISTSPLPSLTPTQTLSLSSSSTLYYLSTSHLFSLTHISFKNFIPTSENSYSFPFPSSTSQVNTLSVRDLSPYVRPSRHLSGVAVTRSLIPYKKHPNTLYTIRTPRRVYSITQADNKLSLLSDTPSTMSRETSTKEIEQGLFIILQTFKGEFLQEKSLHQEGLYSPMFHEPFGYERRAATKTITGVLALRRFFGLMKRFSGEGADETGEALYWSGGQTYIYSFPTFLRNKKFLGPLKRATEEMKKNNGRNYDEEGMDAELARLERERVEKEGGGKWDSYDEWHPAVVPNDDDEEEEENFFSSWEFIAASVVLILIVTAVGYHYVGREKKTDATESLTGSNDSSEATESFHSSAA